jgi:hypothetical protein
MLPTFAMINILFKETSLMFFATDYHRIFSEEIAADYANLFFCIYFKEAFTIDTF